MRLNKHKKEDLKNNQRTLYCGYNSDVMNQEFSPLLLWSPRLWHCWHSRSILFCCQPMLCTLLWRPYLSHIHLNRTHCCTPTFQQICLLSFDSEWEMFYFNPFLPMVAVLAFPYYCFYKFSSSLALWFYWSEHLELIENFTWPKS